MEDQVIHIETVIKYIETHLDGKLKLETVASIVHYSKYHLHRMFTHTVGMTIHDYALRCQLTETAKLLVFSEKPVIEIAYICGYGASKLLLHIQIHVYIPTCGISTEAGILSVTASVYSAREIAHYKYFQTEYSASKYE